MSSPGVVPPEARQSASASGVVPPGAHPSSPESGGTFYRYRDSAGRSVIVDELSRVAPEHRGSVETVVLGPAEAARPGALGRGVARELDMPSFVAGASSALLGAVLFVIVGRKLGRVFRAALVLGVLGLGLVAYLGWVRRTTGHTGELLASPEVLIDDARAAVEKLNRRSAEQQRALKELEQVR